MTASTTFVGGRVFTGRRHVEALLVEGGRVVAVGDRRQVSRSASTGTETVDLRGGLIVPGLIDSHFHLRETALQERAIDLRGTRNITELLSRVTRASEQPSAGPLLGNGWDSEPWPDPRYPTRDDLDRVESHRPVALWRRCGHVAVVNSAAIEELHIVPPRASGNDERWGRDEQGRFNGLLYEGALRALRPFGVEALRRDPEQIVRALGRMASFGVTTVVPMSSDADEIDLSLERENASPLPTRLRFYLRPDTRPHVARLRAALSGTDHAVTGMKIVTDGSMGARTAWLSEAYDDAPGERGLPLGRAAEIGDQLLDAASLGLQPAFHAIGDRAIHRVLRLLEAHHEPGASRIEHASLLGPPLFALADRVRPHLVVQPSFVSSDGWIVARLGPSRARWAYAFRTLHARGYVVAGSSDAPFDEPDPWMGIASATAPRRSLVPGGLAPPENLTVEAALGLYTVGGAAALEEPSLGSLEPGSHADLVHLSVGDLRDILLPRSSLIRSTWMGGRRTFEAVDGPARR